MPFINLEDYFKSKNLIIKECREKGCKLRDIKSDEYLLIDGDSLKLINKSNQLTSSVDCILIRRKPINSQGFEVIFCELTSDDKKIKSLKNKFLNSAKDIYPLFEKFGINIASIRCILIGKLNTYVKNKKSINKTLNMGSMDFIGQNMNNVVFEVYPCGQSIKNII